MTVTLIPDGTKAAAKFLREHADLQDLVGRRVVVKTPGDTAEPWVRYRQIDTQAVYGQRVEHLMMYLVQFDCYAGANGGWPEARAISRTVRAILHDELPNAPGLEAVVTSVEITGDTDLPDMDYEPERERCVLTAQVWAHA